ncbi:hypothetical protein BD311DRAFT_729855 [Dichomitus squalens]|uniref:DUF8212 domain-containing protein n=1 Tax=Dichomitus squalens TaxID=114155 RepID=A0A4Q9MAZ1_9APHY|nr:hypothetical protein BD311DRAFT_729855 [Dichomitus squalens]
MTTHYGEGRRAFRRLQEEILFRIPDQSLFAWGHVCPQQPVWPAGSGHQLSLVLPSQFRGPTSAQSTSSASFFASSPRDFPRSSAVKDLRSLSHDEFLASIKVYDLPAQEYSRTPYGIRTDLPLLSISNQKDSKHDWYIAILACEYHAPNSRGLLGRLCVSETPRFPETTPLQLASAYVRGEQMAPYGLLFIPSSWEIIGRLRNHIENLTVFFPHPGRELSPLQAVNMRDYRNGMHPQVIFTMWAGFSLREQGYCIKTNVFPGHDDIHQISLTKDDYSIHITYQYSSGPSGNMKWRAHIQVVSPASSSTLSREEIHPDLCSDIAAKIIAIAVKRDQREGSEVVRLQSPAGREVILELRIELVSAACYHLRIADKTEAHMATAQASGPVSPWLRPNHRVRVRYRALSHPYPSPQSRIGRISNSMSAVGETTSNAGGGAGQASTPAPRS